MGIREIAHKAGVSISTVSRILNDSKPVSPELRKRVERVVQEEGFVPNDAARTMVIKKTRTAGLVIPKVSYQYHQEIVRHVEDVLETAGYRLIVVGVKDEPATELSYVRLLKQKRVDGIILMHESTDPSVEEFLKNDTTPLVLASIHNPGTPHPVVGIDDRQATYDGTAYLIRHGHTRIGYISGPGPMISAQRLAGYQAALRDHKLPFVETYTQDGAFTLAGGKAAARALLERAPQLTALFVVSDEMAIGAIRAAHELGRSVPENLSILGLDGINLGAYVVPSLTTVAQPMQQIGVRAAEILLQRMNSPEEAVESETLPHTIIERESCRTAT